MTYPHIENIDDYRLYQAAFAEGTEGFEIVTSGDEWGFSWSPCGICNRPLGGERYAMILTNPGPDTPVIETLGCCDCVYYAEYGRLDDLTMLSVGDE